MDLDRTKRNHLFTFMFTTLSSCFLLSLIYMVGISKGFFSLLSIETLVICLTLLGIVVVTYIIKISEGWLEGRSPWIRSSVAISPYFFGAYILRIVWFWWLTPTYAGFVLLQSVALGIVFGTSDYPILHHDDIKIIQYDNRAEFLLSYIHQLWRIGQIVLTSTVVVTGGLFVWAFPRGGAAVARDRVAFLGLPFAIAFGSVLLYILIKTDEIQNKLVRYL